MGSAARKIEKAPPRILGDYTIVDEGPALVIQGLHATPELLGWLRAGHDDGQPELVVTKREAMLIVRRSDGKSLSDRERREVFGLAAVHFRKPLPPRPSAEEMAEFRS
jgi:hypothetical protein